MKYLLLLILPVLLACKSSADNSYQETNLLTRDWKISHEETDGDNIVLRPSDYNFPPRRMREGYVFHEDKSLSYQTLGPTDRPQSERGEWLWKDENTIQMTVDGQVITWRVVSLEKDKLVVKEQ